MAISTGELVQIPTKELKCLREHLKKAYEILDRLGFGLDGRLQQIEAVKKEPTQKQRVNNYSKLLESNTKYQKPKHLQK